MRRVQVRWLPLVTLLLTATVGDVQGQSLKVGEKLEVLEERAHKDSCDAAAQYNVAMGYLSKEKYDAADQALRRAIAIEPQFADAYLALSISRDKDGNYWRKLKKAGKDSVKASVKELEGFYRKAFLLDPLIDVKIIGSVVYIRPWGDFAKGVKDLVEGKYPSAHDHFSNEVKDMAKGGALDSVPEILLWLRALSASHSENYDEAVNDLEVLVNKSEVRVVTDSEPDETPLLANEYRYMMAAIRQKQGRTDDAVHIYQTVLEHDLGNFMAHVQLARIQEKAHNYEAALIERRRAVEANPDDPTLLLDLGVTLGKSGQFTPAAQTLEQAAAANPRDSRPLYWLGIAYDQLQKPVDAKSAYSRFLAIAPSRYEPQITKAKERLTQLQ